MGRPPLSAEEEEELRDSVNEMSKMVKKYRSKVDMLEEELEEVVPPLFAILFISQFQGLWLPL